MKILISFNLKKEYLDRIREVVPEAVPVKALDRESQKKEITDCDVLVTMPQDFQLEMLHEAGSLKWIQAWTAGVDSLTKPERLKFLIDNEIKLTTTSGIHSNIVAEHVMGFMISFSRKLHQYYSQQKREQWQRIRVDQLEGRTVVIIGLGHIGRTIADRARAFKMRTVGVKRDLAEGAGVVDRLYSSDELMTALAEADYVVLALPLTDETSQLFGKDEFAAMKSSAYFINISRGRVVDEEALIRALENGQIAGAGLDVFNQEPLPLESPLYRLDNVLITPHVAGIFPDYNRKSMDIFLKNLQRFRSGEGLLNQVDYNRGY